MDIGVRDRNGFRILDVIGRIDRLKDSIVFKSYVTTLADEEKILRVAVNLSQATYMDSGALNVLIFCHHHLNKLGGKFILVEPNEYVLDVLGVVGFDKLITIYPSEKEFLKNAKKL
ncbi:MAG: STAS domain-containing protein [Chitinispirillales bacterium]|jgi:anti-anti-sigma factor|nr:STAS domain-containing protein [Chitinispirillales bacterium]